MSEILREKVLANQSNANFTENSFMGCSSSTFVLETYRGENLHCWQHNSPIFTPLKDSHCTVYIIKAYQLSELELCRGRAQHMYTNQLTV